MCGGTAGERSNEHLTELIVVVVNIEGNICCAFAVCSRAHEGNKTPRGTTCMQFGIEFAAITRKIISGLSYILTITTIEALMA